MQLGYPTSKFWGHQKCFKFWSFLRVWNICKHIRRCMWGMEPNSRRSVMSRLHTRGPAGDFTLFSVFWLRRQMKPSTASLPEMSAHAVSALSAFWISGFTLREWLSLSHAWFSPRVKHPMLKPFCYRLGRLRHTTKAGLVPPSAMSLSQYGLRCLEGRGWGRGVEWECACPAYTRPGFSLPPLSNSDAAGTRSETGSVSSSRR